MNREDDLIARIARRWAGGTLPRGAIGIGDDAAWLRGPARSGLLVTTDLFVEGVHFDLRLAPARLAGRKALAAAASDIGAMGGGPAGCLLSLAAPGAVPGGAAERILEGFHAQARAYRIPLLGGDLSRSRGGILLDVVVLGRPAGPRPLRRAGARPGDLLCVTGPLGASAAGLALLRARGARGARAARAARALAASRRRGGSRESAERQAVRAHLLPDPPLEAGAAFGRSGAPTAMMDLSDGLAVDLRRLCRAGRTGARIDLAGLPVHPAAEEILGREAAVRAALGGGEDYELLLAVPPGRESGLRRLARAAGRDLIRIGQVTGASGGVVLCGPGDRRRALPRLGYDHFGGSPGRAGRRVARPGAPR